jgi:hypothetical protein
LDQGNDLPQIALFLNSRSELSWKMSTNIRFLRDEQNPRWDDRQLNNWLDREVRFDAAFGSRRVICRIPRRSFVEAFGPVGDRSLFEVFGQYRLTIEGAALAKLHRDEYATDISWEDRDMVSIVLTGAEIQSAIAAESTLPPSALDEPGKAIADGITGQKDVVLTP